MKKLITAIGIIITITTSTILCTLVVKDMKQSVKEYFNNDIVGGGLDEEKYNYVDQNDLPEEIITNNQLNSSSIVPKEDIASANEEILKSITEIGKDKTTSNANNNQKNVSNKSINENMVDKNDDSVFAIRSIAQNTDDIDANVNIVEIDSKNETVGMSETQPSQNGTTKIQLSDKSTIQSNSNNYSFDIEDTKEPSSNISETVQTALNIVNPSILINASNALLIDSKTGKVVYHKNATNSIYPASTTKLMTALVALDYSALTDEVTIGSEIYFMASDSSRAYLSVGQRLTMEMLIEGMLIPSGNDAAYAVAAYVGRVSLANQNIDEKTAVSEFIRLMNKKTTQLGLKNTHFKNPDGYDTNGQYTTAYDLGMIAMEALKNNTIRNITNKTHTRNVFLSGEDVTWYSSNKLIEPGSGVYYKYAIGLKTGSSSLAGRCLVSAAENGTKSYISVVMNSTVSGRWEDSISLLKYGMDHND